MSTNVGLVRSGIHLIGDVVGDMWAQGVHRTFQGVGKVLSTAATGAAPLASGVLSRFKNNDDRAALAEAWLRDLANGYDGHRQGMAPLHPGDPGFGNLLSFMDNPVELISAAYLQEGPVFSLMLGPQPVTVLLGPEGQQFFFANTDKALQFDYPSLNALGAKGLMFLAPSQDAYHAQLLHLILRALFAKLPDE